MMRNLSVIENFMLDNNKVVVLCGKKQLYFLRNYFSKNFLIENCVLIEVNTDFGLRVKDGSLYLDKDNIFHGVSKHITTFRSLIELGKNIIKKNCVSRVISDVTPWILTSAKELGVPSTLMASFTWLDIYEEFLPNELLKPFVECYADAQQVLFYDLANPKTLKRFPQGIKIGLSVRQISISRVKEIKAKYRCKGRPIVFMSVGASNTGVKSLYDVSDLPYNFIVTNGISLTGYNVTHLPLDVLDTQNYIAASDFCISKAGWTSIAEILLARKPMALIKRDDNAEDRYLINELSQRREAIGIELTELSDIEKILNKMKATDWGDYEYYNDSKKIAKLIMNY